MNTDDCDRKLLEAWRQGDALAGNELVRRNFTAVYRFFRGRVAGEVSDLVQGAFLASVRRRDQVPEHVPFRAYLLGIARKELLMHLRKCERKARAFRTHAAGPVADDPSPSMTFALREEQRLLIRALRQLPLDLQLVLELYYWEQLTLADVAHIVEVPVGTVKSRLFRARDQLREHILTMAANEGLGRSTSGAYESWVRSIRGLAYDGVVTPSRVS